MNGKEKKETTTMPFFVLILRTRLNALEEGNFEGNVHLNGNSKFKSASCCFLTNNYTFNDHNFRRRGFHIEIDSVALSERLCKKNVKQCVFNHSILTVNCGSVIFKVSRSIQENHLPGRDHWTIQILVS